MSIMTQLEFELDFSHSEKEIAHYILNEGEKVLNLSIKELAKKTYTSPATIVRLCHKLGLEGYGDFKIKYSAELQFDLAHTDRIDVNFPFNEEDNDSMVAYKLASLNQEVIAETIQLIDFEQLPKMLSGEQVFMSYNSNENKIAMIISYSGETNELIKIAKILKEKKTPIIVLTSIGDNRLSHYASYILNIGSREKIFTKIAPFASQTSIEYILNVIFSCLFKKNYQKNIQNKISYDKENDVRHPLHSPVNDIIE